MSGKLLIVLFAVFLVSVHAFVKRDTATTGGDTNSLDSIQKQVKDLADKFNEQFSEAIKPETIQKGLKDTLENVQKLLNDFKDKTTTSDVKS